jgi:hypothetical protein
VRYAAKFDASHVEITRGLKRLGWPFKDCARYSGLGFDILTKHKDGYPLLLEIKNPGPPSSRELTESEEAMRLLFPQFFRVATNLDEVLRAIGWGP